MSKKPTTIDSFISRIISEKGASSSSLYEVEFIPGNTGKLKKHLKDNYDINLEQGEGSENLTDINLLANEVQIPGVSFISQICVVWMQQFTPEVVNTHLQQLITHAGTDWQFHQRYEPSNIQGKRGVLMFQNIIL